MSRSIKEWTGKTDDTAPPPRVKLRIVDRQDGKCAITGVAFGPKIRPEFDHIIPLGLGGENRESNLQAICAPAHKVKTAGDRRAIAKADRIRKKQAGITPKKAELPGGKNSKWKKRVDGTVVPR